MNKRKSNHFNNGLLAVAVSLSLTLVGCVVETDTTTGSTATKTGITCPPELSASECEYYKDGYRAGAKDAGMSMSMVYQRHEGYDSRFEPFFARGYEAGWLANR